METPPNIKEEGTRWTVENARPFAMRLVIGIVAPLALALIGFAMLGDVRDGHWVFFSFRALFALVVAMAAVFSLFGAETIAVDGGEVVWRRGVRQTRRAPVGEVEKLERVGNTVRVFVRGRNGEEARPIVVGIGLRQSPAAMKWLMQRLDAAIIAARRGT
jgi:hypothetical protein